MRDFPAANIGRQVGFGIDPRIDFTLVGGAEAREFSDFHVGIAPAASSCLMTGTARLSPRMDADLFSGASRLFFDGRAGYFGFRHN